MSKNIYKLANGKTIEIEDSFVFQYVENKRDDYAEIEYR